jgi:hypothetical protein
LTNNRWVDKIEVPHPQSKTKNIKVNVEDNQELRDYVDYKDWKRQKEENNDRIKTADFETKELQRH